MSSKAFEKSLFDNYQPPQWWHELADMEPDDIHTMKHGSWAAKGIPRIETFSNHKTEFYRLALTFEGPISEWQKAALNALCGALDITLSGGDGTLAAKLQPGQAALAERVAEEFLDPKPTLH